jgi:hypothetical protein
VVISKDMVRSSTIFTKTVELVKDLSLLSHRVNMCWKYTVPEFYAQLLEFNKAYAKKTPVVEAFSTLDPLLSEGRELLYNVRLTEHVDRQDPQWSMAVFTVFGEFTGGFIYYPELGYKCRFQPGDGILLRGRVVAHEIEEFEGQRIAIPHFTHSSSWRSLGMGHIVNHH